MYSLHGFLFKIFFAPHGITRGLPETASTGPFLRAPSCLPHPVSRPSGNSRHRAPETQKGGKISPAARQG